MNFLRALALSAATLLLGLVLHGPAQASCGPSNPNCIVPTAPVGTSDNQAASTAFVQQNIAPFLIVCPTHEWVSTIGAALSICTQPSAGDFTAGALANGTTATTQAVNDDTTDLATDAFVQTQIAAQAANPTATAGPAAVNGSAGTFMRSDAAPAVQKGSSSQFGLMECDNVTITCPGGVLSGSASSGNGYYTLSHQTGSWVCSTPTGATVSTSGTTTSGLQECINAQQTAKANLRVVCTAANQTPLVASTTVTFGPNIFASYDLRGCVLQSSATSVADVDFDTFAQGVHFDWGGGEIVATASNTGALVLFKPTTADPVFGSKVSEASFYHLPYILGYGSGSAGGTSQGIRINPNATTTTAFVNNILIVDGIDGNAASLNVNVDFLIDNPTATTNGVAQNWINIPFVGNFDAIGIQVEPSNPSIANSVLNNWWYVNINNGNNAGTAIGIVSIGGNDMWVGSVTSNAGVMSVCLDFAGNKAVDNNALGLTTLEGCTTPVADSGSRNSYANVGSSGVYVIGSAAIYMPTIGTTASAANAFINNSSAPANQLLRSTSSARYKKDIRPITLAEARKVLNLTPVSFKSLASADDPNRKFEGLIAEQVAQDFPQFTNYMKDKDGKEIPDGVQYDRVSAVAMLKVLQDDDQRIMRLEIALALLVFVMVGGLGYSRFRSVGRCRRAAYPAPGP